VESNADRVRWGFNRLMDGDIEALIAFAHDDIEFTPLLTGHAGEPYVGHDGIREWFADLQIEFERIASRLESVIEVGDTVIAEGELIVIGSGETPTVRQSVAWVVEMDHGRATKLEVFGDIAAARRRAGIDQ
jgi:ketosteroid isomerase-like protein